MCKNAEECKFILKDYQFDLSYINPDKADIYLDYILLPYEDAECCQLLNTQHIFLRISFMEENHRPALVTENSDENIFLDLCLEDELKLAWYLYFRTVK